MKPKRQINKTYFKRLNNSIKKFRQISKKLKARKENKKTKRKNMTQR